MNTLQEARATLPTDDFSFDEDIREIFIDEAVEVLQEMDINLPKWTDDPADFKPLTEVRRGFHTLKGSGRMVGALTVGETAWAVENLLNRVLDKKVAVNAELVNFINEAKMFIPHLINDFANNEAPSADPAALILRAENLRLQRDINTGMDEEPVVAAPVTEPEATYEDSYAPSYESPTIQAEEVHHSNQPLNPADYSNEHFNPAVQEDSNIASFDDIITTNEDPFATADTRETSLNTASYPTETHHPEVETIDLTSPEPTIADELNQSTTSSHETATQNSEIKNTLNKQMFFIGLGLGLLILLLLLL